MKMYASNSNRNRTENKQYSCQIDACHISGKIRADRQYKTKFSRYSKTKIESNLCAIQYKDKNHNRLDILYLSKNKNLYSWLILYNSTLLNIVGGSTAIHYKGKIDNSINLDGNSTKQYRTKKNSLLLDLTYKRINLRGTLNNKKFSLDSESNIDGATSATHYKGHKRPEYKFSNLSLKNNHAQLYNFNIFIRSQSNIDGGSAAIPFKRKIINIKAMNRQYYKKSGATNATQYERTKYLGAKLYNIKFSLYSKSKIDGAIQCKKRTNSWAVLNPLYTQNLISSNKIGGPSAIPLKSFSINLDGATSATPFRGR